MRHDPYGMGEQGDPDDFGRRYHTCSVSSVGHWRGKPGRLFTDHDDLDEAKAAIPRLHERYPDAGSIEIWDTVGLGWVTGEFATGVR
jgi:hypothetical protein